jgi:hypothetical protein
VAAKQNSNAAFARITRIGANRELSLATDRADCTVGNEDFFSHEARWIGTNRHEFCHRRLRRERGGRPPGPDQPARAREFTPLAGTENLTGKRPDEGSIPTSASKNRRTAKIFAAPKLQRRRAKPTSLQIIATLSRWMKTDPRLLPKTPCSWDFCHLSMANFL